jgi:hypothetical protein
MFTNHVHHTSGPWPYNASGTLPMGSFPPGVEAWGQAETKGKCCAACAASCCGPRKQMCWPNRYEVQKAIGEALDESLRPRRIWRKARSHSRGRAC